ncbi:unnamed protein product [Thelazia callipaeda]|uniref:Piezo_RRas_bdg domain-containing protein n=1 Tax=Thelazia callipaeda TaxID=103827 RepID=A0A0N5CXE1_THECL|nr:unnamed protein product [Thelazia callipaeda]
MSHSILFYFLSVAFALKQLAHFQIERNECNDMNGDSNDGITLALQANKSLEFNPVHDYYSTRTKIFLDVIKQLAFSYFHWIPLLLVFSHGIRFSLPIFLSTLLIVLAFINMWRGADLYLSDPKVFIRSWRLLTLYLLTIIFFQIAAIIALTFFEYFIQQESQKSLAYALFHVHFQRTVVNIRADRIVCYRGVVLYSQLIFKGMTVIQQEERVRLATLRHTINGMEKMDLSFGKWQIEFLITIRGWNEKLLSASEMAIEKANQDSLNHSLKIDYISDALKEQLRDDISMNIKKKRKKQRFISLSSLLESFAFWLSLKTLDYRYIRYVINKEKELLLQKLPQELSLVSEESLAKLQGYNLGNSICLVKNVTDILKIPKYMNDVHNRWLQLSLSRRLLSSVGTFIECNISTLCFIVMIIVHGNAQCLLTLPLALLVYFWGALTDHGFRLMWIIAIFYVQIMIVVMICFKYTSLPWVCTDTERCSYLSASVIGSFVGIADEPMSVLLLCILVLALFTQRHIMRRNGFWYVSSKQLLRNRSKQKSCLLTILADMFKSHQQTPYNYYPWMILSDLAALTILIFNFSHFDLARRDALMLTEIKSHLLPDTFIYYFMTSIIMIFLDRIIYLRKSIHNEAKVKRVSNGLFLWYMARGNHMLASAFQIRDGYPQYIIGHTMMKPNPIHWILYAGFFYAVPLFEITSVLDWTFTRTTLTMLEFYKLQTINYYLYFIHGLRKLEVFYPRKRAETISMKLKVFIGGGTLLGIFVGVFLPVDMVLTLRIGYHAIIYEYHTEDLPLISVQEYNQLTNYFEDDHHARNYLYSLGPETIIDVTLNEQGITYYVHPIWETQLIKLITSANTPLKIKCRMNLKRMRLQEQEIQILKKIDSTPLEAGREWDMDMTQNDMKRLLKVLKSENCNDSFEMDISKIVPSLISVPNEGLLYEKPKIVVENLKRKFVYLNYTYQFHTKLIIKTDCTNQPNTSYRPHAVSIIQQGFGHNGLKIGPPTPLRFLLFVSKVSSSYLRFLNISTPSLLVTIVMIFLMSCKIRDILMTKPFELTFKEIGDPTRLLYLCHDISLVREAKLFDLEHDLFGKLVYVLRSSEALIHFTKFEMKNLF